MTERITLPIDPHLSSIIKTIESGSAIVVQATPGSGKTTRIPPALLDAKFRKPEQSVIVLEPRRLAAKFASFRVAFERGENAGETVGYQFRFEKSIGPKTRLLFLTEGMLMRRLLDDPKLARVAAVVLDEFHERNLHGDLALAYLRHLQLTSRPDLKIVVMSATLDTDAVAGYLGNCPIVKVDCPMFPVDISYLGAPAAKSIELLVRDAVLETQKVSAENTLVFLPGMSEIRKSQDALSSFARERGFDVFALHGELSADEQNRALAPGGRPKVILSTNVAETSLTIEGVTTVIDSGLHRSATYSWWSGVPALRTKAISRASAIQRAGRAGRTAPGRCRRLYTKADFDSRPSFEIPEVQRADLSPSYLELKRLGIVDPKGFPWFEKPAPAALEAARDLLYLLGAIGDTGSLTAIGETLSRIPAHPRLGRLLIEAEKRGVLDSAATLAALISEGDLDRMDALNAVDRGFLYETTKKARRQYLAAFASSTKSAPDAEALGRSVLAGFPDRVGKKRAGARNQTGDTEIVLSSGGSARVEDKGVIAESEYFVVLDLQEQKGLGQLKSTLRVRSVCAIESDWLWDLQPSLLKEIEKVGWDGARQRIAAQSGIYYSDICLSESSSEARDNDEIRRVLLKEGLGTDPQRLFTLNPHDFVTQLAKLWDPEQMASLIARLQLVSLHYPDRGLPDWSTLRAAFPDIIVGKKSLDELRKIEWTEEWLGKVSPSAPHELNRLAPGHFTLSAGRRVPIHYPLDRGPWIESRLQDFFGMRQAPSILDGRVRLTLHLLAPNQRAVQVTHDLPGFWEREYPRLRKELGRRYPRHAWPEDPLAIPPKKEKK